MQPRQGQPPAPRRWLVYAAGALLVVVLLLSAAPSRSKTEVDEGGIAGDGVTKSAAPGPDDGYGPDDPGNVTPDQEQAEEGRNPKAAAALEDDPEKCKRAMHFLPWNQQRKHPVALASFPGSGNTYMRFLVEQGTRVYTGSVYHDMELNTTYPGEGLEDTQVIAVKTHYPCPNCWTYQRCPVCAGGYPVTAPMTGPVVDADAAVFLLRSPFDALLAEFHRLRTGKHTGELQPEDFRKVPKRKSYETEFDKPSWNDFINQRLVAWAKAASTYLDHPTEAKSPKEAKELDAKAAQAAAEAGGGGGGSSSPAGAKGTAPTLTPEQIEQRKKLFERSDRFVTKGGRLVKLVFYERLKKNPQAELERVFRFLQDLYESEGVKDALISPPSLAAKCALDHYKAAAATHFTWQRPHTQRFNPWTPAQIKTVCKAVGKWWFTNVWGDCLAGKLQWERDAAAAAAATTPSAAQSGGADGGEGGGDDDKDA